MPQEIYYSIAIVIDNGNMENRVRRVWQEGRKEGTVSSSSLKADSETSGATDRSELRDDRTLTDRRRASAQGGGACPVGARQWPALAFGFPLVEK
jgi:hypothetical protein